jgi:hypothetical protein
LIVKGSGGKSSGTSIPRPLQPEEVRRARSKITPCKQKQSDKENSPQLSIYERGSQPEEVNLNLNDHRTELALRRKDMLSN